MVKVEGFSEENKACAEVEQLKLALEKLTVRSNSMGATIECDEHHAGVSLNLLGVLPKEERTFVPETEGWMTDDEMHILYELAIGLPEEMGVLLEVGSWKGRSASALALAGPVICVDVWTGIVAESKEEAEKASIEEPAMVITTFPDFIKNIDSIGLRHRTIVLSGDSKKVLPMLKGTQVRLALIDASHAYEDVKIDIENVWSLLSDGAFLVMDDYDWPGVRKACDEFSNKHGFVFQKLPGKLATTVRFADKDQVEKLRESAK